MSFKTDLELAYHMGYDDALAKRKPDPSKTEVLDLSNCKNNERTSAAYKPITYDNGYSMDRLVPGEYYEFWEPACACGNCGELIPMRKFCPNCGCRLEVDEWPTTC